MRAGCLLGVLLLAKALILAGTGAPMAGWAPLAYFWQDVVVAIAAAGLDALARRPRTGWVLYGALVAYIAWGVPVAIVIGSPLTWPMIRAARGPLADSIAYYFTAVNFTRIALVAASGVALPFVLARLRRSRPRLAAAPWNRLAVVVGVLFLVTGPMAASRVETIGLDRNAITALMPIGLIEVGSSAAAGDWRASPMPAASGPGPSTLSRFRGTAKGFNVIVIALESTAAQYLKPYGAAQDPMPNLTALSQRAILFENAYAAYPESIKGLFSILCSRYPAFGLSPEVHAAAPCASVASQLAGAGYRTALFHSGRFGYLGMDAVIANKGFDTVEDAGAIGGHVESSFGVDEPAAVARLLGWIDAEAAGTPFLATYLPVAGHHPYATPSQGPFAGDSELARYQNALHYGDESLGALVAGLRARHLDDRTLLVVFGDHGEAFGQHPGNIGHTLFINEENVRVPFLIAIPGAPTGPVRVADTASLIDIAPTMLDLLGLPQVSAYQGTSLLRPGARMALFFTDYSLGFLGLRDGCWKFILEINADRSKLFDVCRDPAETVNVAEGHAGRIAAYRERVSRWSAAQKAMVMQNGR